MQIKNIVHVCILLCLCQAKASPLEDRVVAKTKATAQSSCDAAYRLWYSENRGQKKVSSRLKSLITHACAGRFFIYSLKCTQPMFNALNAAKERGEKEVPPHINLELKTCIEKCGAQSKEDTKLLADYASSGQESQLQHTLRQWQQDGSLKYFKEL